MNAGQLKERNMKRREIGGENEGKTVYRRKNKRWKKETKILVIIIWAYHKKVKYESTKYLLPSDKCSGV